MPKSEQKQGRALCRRPLFWILLSALALRLVFAFATDGYPYDMSCFVAWGEKLAAEGPAAFYSDGYFADYPPGYLWVLALVAAVRGALGLSYQSGTARLLLAVVPALCDCASAYLIYRVGARKTGERAALCLAAFTAFSPLSLFDTGIWKQIDGAFALPILLCFFLLEQRHFLPAALAFGAALAVKPQALLFGPVLAACFLAALYSEKDKLRAFARCLGGAALALLPPLAAGLPFFGVRELVSCLLEKYFGTIQSYPYATINAFNWLAALGGNWQGLENYAFWGVSWRALGIMGIVLVTAGLLFFAVKGARSGRFSPVLLAAYYELGIFTFAHCMHERYMVAGVLLALLAAALCNDLRLYAAAFGLSLTGFVNLATVYSLTGTEDEWLTSATSASVAVCFGVAETACYLLLLFAVWDLVVHGHNIPLPVRGAAARAAALTAVPADVPKWRKKELGALAVLTLCTAVISFWRLGSMTAPQNALDATGTTLTESVTLAGDTAAVWLYPGISYGGSVQIQNAAGETLLEKELNYGTCFSWSSAECSALAGETLTVTVTNAQLFELAFRTADGALVSVSGGGALCDEQGAVPDAVSEQNSMYFDEIYHGRTGYEQLHGLTVYETTHPPLGKDFIMLGIALFGMTAFGWRCAGTLFGVLLVPLAWCFARRLTRKRWAGAAAGVLLALDLMRFAQSRIATIDIYGTFFILLGAHCMVWYCQSVLKNGVNKSLLPMALGGAAFGLGCASKWTGIYAGIGLAILYLGVLVLRARQNPPHFWREFRTAALGGVLFYIALPFCIYVVSYFPYWLRDPGFDLADWWQCQLSMYNYHANLQATHPFESRWYTWLLGLRPVWYYQNTHLADGTKASIAGLAGPVIWLGGLAALIWLAWRQISGRGSRTGAGVLVLYAAQLVPWMLVSRCTFLYHYFPCSMFCLAALVLALTRMPNERRAKRMAAALCAVSALVFVLYCPAVSALPVPAWYAEALEFLPSFGFY